MHDIKSGCGIDMAKDKFNCCLSTIDTSQQVRIRAQSTFPNTVSGFEVFLAWTQKYSPANVPLVFLMEATGIYYEGLAWYLHNHDQTISVVLPNKAKKYKDSLGLKSKNDKIDAQALAAMCCERQHNPWKPLTKSIYGLRILTRQLESLGALKTAASSQLQALQYGMYRDAATEKMLGKQIDLYEKQKEGLENRIAQLIEKDPVLKGKFRKILTLKGLGLIPLAVIVAETNGFAAFECAPQLVSYSGYDVVENQSGDHRSRTKISKKGNAHIRRALFFAAFNMVRYGSEHMAALYARVYGRSRVKMKAYVAVQKKLLTIVYALWKKDEAFDPGYEHEMVKKQQAKVQQPAQAEVETSGEMEVAPSLATAGRQGVQEQERAQARPQEKVIPATKAGTTQDRHPSKHRRTPSLAKSKIHQKYLS